MLVAWEEPSRELLTGGHGYVEAAPSRKGDGLDGRERQLGFAQRAPPIEAQSVQPGGAWETLRP